jgi:hypothetical protein
MSQDSSMTLYYFESDAIKISIDARFEGDALIIDGYDIGKQVEAYWGDSDYEYIVTIPAESVKQLYPLLNIVLDDRQGLLQELAKRYHTNSCYSDIRKLLDDHKINYEGFTWV